MELVIRIIGIITPVLIISAFGFAYAKLKQPDLSVVNRLSTDMLYPLLIYTAMASKDFHILDYLPLIGGGLAVLAGSGLIAWWAARLLNYNRYAFIPSMMFTNVANMGLPLTLFAFGAEMLPAAVSLFMAFSLVHFSIGIRLCAPHVSVKGILRGPMLWAMIGGIVSSLIGFTLPDWLAASTKMLGDAAIPLGLFTVGVGFAQFRVERWSIGIVGAILCPLSGLLIAWPLVQILPMSAPMKGVLLLYAALPPAVMNYIFAERYDQDPGLVSAIVVVGNIASIVFIPLALYLAI
ncbi:AEC family transporter [Propionivibrio sp.]|jgi:predicted permease|uniref:AEC family transporter n=1 Tax=Propionivibrio sp. TaxID=2212460 RepID=UPI00272EDD0F|nr:AEC family transporter [Propionivibrio sp.]